MKNVCIVQCSHWVWSPNPSLNPNQNLAVLIRHYEVCAFHRILELPVVREAVFPDHGKTLVIMEFIAFKIFFRIHNSGYRSHMCVLLASDSDSDISLRFRFGHQPFNYHWCPIWECSQYPDYLLLFSSWYLMLDTGNLLVASVQI